MKYLILALVLLAGCASPTKYVMKNCTQIRENVFLCETIPEPREHGGPR